MAMTSPTANLGRISRTSVYIEPLLYDVVQREAEKAGMTYSTYLRKLILRELVNTGALTAEDMLKLAGVS